MIISEIQYDDIQSAEFLKLITGLLDDAQITYWLDTGTLLGVIRDNNFIPWDADIDIGIWDEQEQSLLQVLDKLPKKSYYILNKENEDSIQIIMNKEEVSTIHYRYIDITTYHKTNDSASRRWISIQKKTLSDLTRKNLYLLLAIRAKKFYGTQAFNNARNMLTKKMIIKFNSCLYKINSHLINNLIDILVKHILNKRQKLTDYVRVTIPLAFFVHLGTISFKDNNYSIPQNFNEYLIWRYGSDWHIPQKKWDCIKNDNAIEL